MYLLKVNNNDSLWRKVHRFMVPQEEVSRQDQDAVSATESLLQWSFSKMKGVEEAGRRGTGEGAGEYPHPSSNRHILTLPSATEQTNLPQGYKKILPGFSPTTYILR